MNVQQLENELWEAADQLRANSKLTATEYSMPVLGLIFLRHANNRFNAFLPEILAEIPANVPEDRREKLVKLKFESKAAIYLPESTRFDHIAALPQDASIGEAIDAAMAAIEAEYPVLEGALPRGYSSFEPDLLADLIKILDRPALKNATGDVFGRIYEYFLNKFAMTGAQEGGEFFTPPSLVRMIVNIIEPDHGTVLDPACGSAGMFVQTSHFIEDVRHADTNTSVIFHGQEKSDTNTRLARMNMVVHGLDASNLRQGNTFYDQIEELIGHCDYVMANPPFNVDGVDAQKIKSQVDKNGRLPFGLPGLNGKTGAISNANSLWIQYFYAYLNESGRAGFVMASSASDAGNKDRDIRQQLVQTGHVDVMMAIGNKFFYTRSLPCTLWFFDKGKPADLQDQVLMIDARNVYHVVSARSHIFTDEQLANLTAIAWLYRGESDKYLRLLKEHYAKAASHLSALPERLTADTAAIQHLASLLQGFAQQATLDELNKDLSPEEQLQQSDLDACKTALDSATAALANTQDMEALLTACAEARKAIETADLSQKAQRDALQQHLDSLHPKLKAGSKMLEARHKAWLHQLEAIEKLRPRLSKAWDAKTVREARKALLATDERTNEIQTPRDAVLDTLKQAGYFIQQGHWLHSRFPDAVYSDVPGLCKAVTQAEIEANDWSLTPGRYVGVAPDNGSDDEDFVERLRAIQGELAELNDQAASLAAEISKNLESILV
ncbi:N-6 DNA methylase [Lautropia mirabilis]|jgi:type I restriction-modification system DNA methyltransferase subunit